MCGLSSHVRLSLQKFLKSGPFTPFGVSASGVTFRSSFRTKYPFGSFSLLLVLDLEFVLPPGGFLLYQTVYMAGPIWLSQGCLFLFVHVQPSFFFLLSCVVDFSRSFSSLFVKSTPSRPFSFTLWGHNSSGPSYFPGRSIDIPPSPPFSFRSTRALLFYASLLL